MLEVQAGEEVEMMRRYRAMRAGGIRRASLFRSTATRRASNAKELEELEEGGA